MSDVTDEGIMDKPPGSPWGLYLGVALAGVAVFGLFTWMLGLGPFAYRQILYGTAEIYILNMTDQPVTVQLDSGTPIEVGPESAERTPILGGTTRIITRSESGEVLEEVDAFVDGNPVFYNVSGERCLVLSDVSSFYMGSPQPGVEIQEVFKKGTRIVPLPNERVIWPRETLRDQLTGAGNGVAWIELVGCTLTEPQERHVLQSYLDVQLTERKRVEQERRKAEEIRRQMMRGGGEAVDEALGKKPGGGGARLAVPPSPGDAGVAPAPSPEGADAGVQAP